MSNRKQSRKTRRRRSRGRRIGSRRIGGGVKILATDNPDTNTDKKYTSDVKTKPTSVIPTKQYLSKVFPTKIGSPLNKPAGNQNTVNPLSIR